MINNKIIHKIILILASYYLRPFHLFFRTIHKIHQWHVRTQSVCPQPARAQPARACGQSCAQSCPWLCLVRAQSRPCLCPVRVRAQCISSFRSCLCLVRAQPAPSQALSQTDRPINEGVPNITSLNHICFAQNPPILTYIGGPKGEALHLSIKSSILEELP